MNHADEIAPLMIWGVMEMWVVLIASSVPPVWPLVRRLRLTAFVGLKHNGLRWGQQDTANSDFGKPPAGKGDTPRHLKLHRLVNRSASQEAIVPPGGIGMKRDFVVTHDALPPSDANGDPDLGSTHFENAYGRPPWENDRV